MTNPAKCGERGTLPPPVRLSDCHLGWSTEVELSEEKDGSRRTRFRNRPPARVAFELYKIGRRVVANIEFAPKYGSAATRAHARHCDAVFNADVELEVRLEAAAAAQRLVHREPLRKQSI
ncbi:uncharacterized protein LOC120358834 [Solenopsis invicta]|uniref:uncharacterized protein LOC120358834 n=1 Tax=Solenopsis invicta TaxID=13686 RepID=UPI00193E63D4|nr:uncharacterized protein LOC120358834 [Solenopsis invicta]